MYTIDARYIAELIVLCVRKSVTLISCRAGRYLQYRFFTRAPILIVSPFCWESEHASCDIPPLFASDILCRTFHRVSAVAMPSSTHNCVLENPPHMLDAVKYVLTCTAACPKAGSFTVACLSLPRPSSFAQTPA